MANDPPVHLEILLTFDAKAVSGTISEDDGRRCTFTGWLGLMSALERLRCQAASAAGSSTRDDMSSLR